MTGVTLLAIGHHSYGYWAYNMAMSLRVHSPTLPIQLIHDDNAIKDLSQEKRKIFDEFTKIDTEDSYDNGRVNPSKAKLSIYKYLKYDRTIYLDVDGLVTNDLRGLCSKCAEFSFATQIVGQATINSETFDEMQWADIREAYKHFKLKDDAIFPATNSSFMWIKKGREAKKIFADALRFYKKPMKLKMKWGKTKTQPDELYLNASLAKNGFVDIGKPGFFRTRHETKATIEEIQEHYFIGLWGDKRMNQSLITGTGNRNSGLYNKLVRNYSTKLFGVNKPEYHYFFLEKHKFYNG